MRFVAVMVWLVTTGCNAPEPERRVEALVAMSEVAPPETKESVPEVELDVETLATVEPVAEEPASACTCYRCGRSGRNRHRTLTQQGTRRDGECKCPRGWQSIARMCRPRPLRYHPDYLDYPDDPLTSFAF